MSETNYYVDSPWTWRERLRYWLYPPRHCGLPEAPAVYKDCLVTKVTVYLSWPDRLRVFVSGRLTVETKTVTENTVGGCISNSVSYPRWGA